MKDFISAKRGNVHTPRNRGAAGWGRGGPRMQKRGNASRGLGGIWKILIAIVAFAVGAICALLWFGRAEVSQVPAAPEVRDERPRFQPPGKPTVSSPAKGPSVMRQPAKKAFKRPSFMDSVRYEDMTSDQKMERARYLAQVALRDGKFGVDVQTADPNDKPILTNAVHMSFVKYMQPGNMVPPPMLISDEAAYAACSIPVNYDPEDSDEVLFWKSQVEEQLKELKEYMDAGHSAMEYYELLDRRQQAEAATMDEARSTIYGLVREGKYEEAEMTVDAFNKYLKSKGLPTIRLSPRVKHELTHRREAAGATK